MKADGILRKYPEVAVIILDYLTDNYLTESNIMNHLKNKYDAVKYKGENIK